jgi:hypothetical protein
MALISTEKFGEHHVKIEFDAARGKFYAELPDDGQYSNVTIDGLREALKRAVTAKARSKPIEISIVGVTFGKDAKKSWAKEEFRDDLTSSLDAVLRGVNSRTRALLLTIGDKKIQAGGYELRDGIVTKRLSPAQHKEYRQLAETVAAAQADLNAFVAKWQINPRKLEPETEE